jgi:hypothetical protein
MAGNIFAKERGIVTLTSTGSSITTASAAVANATADFDARTGGNAPDDLQAQFQLTCQWATITGIVANTVVAELYLLPALDGTNFPDVDLTGGASYLPSAAYAGSFVCALAPTTNVNMTFISSNVLFNPLKLRPYILNRSGQTISANWTLKAVSVQAQYN